MNNTLTPPETAHLLHTFPPKFHNHPFRSGDGHYVHIDAASRLIMVKTFDAERCRAALALKPEATVQKTVRQALERRLRQLAKEAELAKAEKSEPAPSVPAFARPLRVADVSRHEDRYYATLVDAQGVRLALMRLNVAEEIVAAVNAADTRDALLEAINYAIDALRHAEVQPMGEIERAACFLEEAITCTQREKASQGSSPAAPPSFLTEGQAIALYDAAAWYRRAVPLREVSASEYLAAQDALDAALADIEATRRAA